MIAPLNQNTNLCSAKRKRNKTIQSLNGAHQSPEKNVTKSRNIIPNTTTFLRMALKTMTELDPQLFSIKTIARERLPKTHPFFMSKPIDLSHIIVSESNFKRFIIFSDSISVLLSLESKTKESPLIVRLLCSLNSVSESRQIVYINMRTPSAKKRYDNSNEVSVYTISFSK